MKPTERQSAILECLERRGACTYEELSGLLKVSSMTVRRDVDAMSRAGNVVKTLGGVQRSAEADLYETDLRARLSEHRTEKRLIARAAVEQVTGRATVFLDGGTTCIEFAKVLAAERSGLTVVTNSALACLELGRNRDNMTIGIGGQYEAECASFVGPTAEESAGRFFVDAAFISTKGFLPDQGTFESSISTFHIKQIIARQATRVILLVDHSKFNQRALSKVLDIGQIHVVVTDDAAPADALRTLRELGREVVVVDDGALAAGAPSKAAAPGR